MNEFAVESNNQSGASRSKTRGNVEKAVMVVLGLSLIGLFVVVFVPLAPPARLVARLNERTGPLTLVSILTSALAIGQSLLHQYRKLELESVVSKGNSRVSRINLIKLSTLQQLFVPNLMKLVLTFDGSSICKGHFKSI